MGNRRNGTRNLQVGEKGKNFKLKEKQAETFPSCYRDILSVGTTRAMVPVWDPAAANYMQKGS